MVLEIFGVVFGFLYLYLEIMQKKGMWVVGFLMAVVYAVVYWQQEVYASMAFQVYYVVVSVYGFVLWGRDKILGRRLPAASGSDAGDPGRAEENSDSVQQIIYRRLSLKVFVWSMVVLVAATAFMVYVLGRYTSDPMPLADSLIMVLSAIATFWLSKSYREQWLVWLFVNGVTVVMSLNLHLYLTALLYFVNFLASFWGYFYWKKRGRLV